jgi:ABC-type transport system involved in cytochrome bd biosynthesis fused ATPase/permease subunit
MSTVIPFDLDNQKSVKLSSCVLAKPNQLLSIIICLFLNPKIYLIFRVLGFKHHAREQEVGAAFSQPTKINS